MLDYTDELIITIGILTICLMVLLFTSYNSMDNNITSLVILYGLMIITGLTIYHALNTVHNLLDTEDSNTY